MGVDLGAGDMRYIKTRQERSHMSQLHRDLWSGKFPGHDVLTVLSKMV